MRDENLSPNNRLVVEGFPLSNAYHPDWVIENASGGANALWLTEWLTSALPLEPGMRVLDLGCGRASSSIFLAREYAVNVWATDLWFSASENLERIRDADVDTNVFPIHSDARSLPFAQGFFDAILSIDAFSYFGTDDHYLNYLAQFVKPGGIIAIAGAGLVSEIEEDAPDHLAAWFKDEPSLWCLHSSDWWRRRWERTGILEMELSDSMPEGWQLWLEWLKIVAPDNRTEIETIETDAGRHLTYNRVIGRRRVDAVIHEPIVSIPANYVSKPLLRVQPTGGTT